jgi:hypothetical protein
MKRNLLFYAYPRHCGMLDLNLHRLHKYWGAFNGRKIILAAFDHTTMDETHFRWRLHGHGIVDFELIARVNDPRLGESAHFFELLSHVQSQDPNEVSFFAHAKGVSPDVFTRRGTTIQEISTWVDIMYKANLENISEVERALTSHPCAGTLIQSREITGMSCPWYYAGTFYWFNHAALFTPGWRQDSVARFTAEEYPGNRFKREEAHCFGGLENKVDLYRKKTFDTFAPIENNFEPSKVSLVVTCKNRIEFLRQSLPTWCGRGLKEIIVVDWSSDTPIRSEIQNPPGENFRIARVEGQAIFNAGQARNTGARVSTGEYILFIDADMKISNWDATKWMTLKRGRFMHGMDDYPPFGTFIVNRQDFEDIGGHAENMPSYGYEDNDIFNRLQSQAGAELWYYDDSFVTHIEHSDDLRSKHRDQQGRSLHETVKANRQQARVQPWTRDCKQADVPIILQ